MKTNSLNVEQKNSNFVDTIRQEQATNRSPGQIKKSEQGIEVAIPYKLVVSKVVGPGLEEAQARAAIAVVEAEKFRATVAKPTGKANKINLLELIQKANLDGGMPVQNNTLNMAQPSAQKAWE